MNQFTLGGRRLSYDQSDILAVSFGDLANANQLVLAASEALT
jgi:hypothetical protein